jgi:tetratricopeptide (TPR) repeat protein
MPRMKTRFRTTLLASLALALSACGLSPEERLDRAEAAFAEHRFNEARLDIGTLLQDNPDDPHLLEMLARIQLQLGDGVGARSSLARLAEVGARPQDYDLLLAEALLLAGDNAAALAAGLALDSADGLRVAALAHLALGDREAAAAAFARGAQQSGASARLLADYARFMLQSGDPARAWELASQAREADPQGLDPLLASAAIKQAMGEPSAALAFFEQARAAWPESRAALLGQIGVLGDTGRIAEAAPLIEEAARWLPGDADVTYLQARLAAEDGEWQQVREFLQPIEARDNPAQQLLYARALIELDLPEQALPRLAALARQQPGNAAVLRLLARAQLATGNAAAAVATIRPLANSAEATPVDLALFAEAAGATGREAEVGRARSAVPSAERVARLLAEADGHLRNERWAAAIAAYEQLRTWTGDSNAMVLNNLAFAKSRVGQQDEALAMAVRALELEPNQPNIMDTAGWLMVQSGSRRTEGIALLERAARLAPDNRTIANHLAEARRM